MMKPKYKRLSTIIIAAFSLIIGLWLILDSFNQNVVFFLTPTELKNNTTHQIIRIGGMVKKDSVIKLNDQLVTKFIITDNQTDLTIVYTGLLPSLFREGQGVVAKGKFTNDVFEATELLVKHDENYMPKEIIQGYMKIAK